MAKPDLAGPKIGALAFIEKSVRRFTPPRIKSYLKYKVPIQLTWNREDPPQWPLPGRASAHGLDKYEYSIFSQNGEDGILRHLFAEIGFSSRKFLEFGFEGKENNSLRLILKEGFSGVFIDGSKSAVAQFKKAANAFGITDVKAVNAFINLENIELLIKDSGLLGEIDLLSIDVDGNDYWFWERLTIISPRVVVIEYNASLGPELSLTIPYEPTFNRIEKHATGFYHGASLAALERLGKRKGYNLIGCDEMGVNAFFVRDDCMTQSLEVTTSRVAFRPHRGRLARGFTVEDQSRIIEDMTFIAVE